MTRKLGTFLLTETMDLRPGIGLESYNQLFPNQDTLPQGGFGNLIALPLQKLPREQGNSVFLNDNFEPHPDQWAWLSSNRARSATEAFLYRRLETLSQTVGRFRLNAELPIPFDNHGCMEVDLLCADARLAVELDGAQHLLDSSQAYRRDRRKDILLQQRGYLCCDSWLKTSVNNSIPCWVRFFACCRTMNTDHTTTPGHTVATPDHPHVMAAMQPKLWTKSARGSGKSNTDSLPHGFRHENVVAGTGPAGSAQGDFPSLFIPSPRLTEVAGLLQELSED